MAANGDAHGYPILEYDEAREAVLEPSRLIQPEDVPRHAVVCFFQDVISRLAQQHSTQTIKHLRVVTPTESAPGVEEERGAKVIKHLRSEIGTHPIYELEAFGKRLAVFHPGVGALLTWSSPRLRERRAAASPSLDGVAADLARVASDTSG
jgi:uridine phosphorylase